MQKRNKLLITFILGAGLFLVLPSLCLAVSSAITVQATVLENTSFDATAAPINFNVLVPGKVVYAAPITVTMASNAFPWTVRIYTQNQSVYTGTGSPAGLIGASDPRESVALKVWCANYGPGTSYPDVENTTYWSDYWLKIPDESEMTVDSSTWRQLAYINSEGDKSLGGSFDVYIAADFSNASAQSYSGTIIVEFINPDQGAASSRTVTINSTATVPESTSFSVSAPAAVLDFGALLPDKIMFKNPITVNINSNLLSWSIRTYTVNSGIYMGAGSPAGLVGVGDASVVLPLKVWCANFGPGSTPPDIDTGNFWEDNWFKLPDYAEMDSNPYSWRRLAYRSAEKNASLGNSFDVYLAADFRSAPAQTYNGNIVFELLNQ